MLNSVSSLPGDHLGLSEYDDDFGDRFRSLRNADVWKLERQQEFHEPESESWMAFLQGRREESLRLMEADRPALRKLFEGLAQVECRVRRVRVVEKPISTYLLWELHSARIRAQCGEDIRVITPEALSAFEQESPVPEIVILGDEVTYRILYDAQGEAEGAVRYTDPAVLEQCRAEITALHEQAEPVEDYFVREMDGVETPRAR
ncbi:hypothetical protein NE857_13205 [Nocardiopsis exhalans]|uniref:DUF6879 domain-containing protein n=1 Tax=Nocardiopsis exhalans TaxID=163604 RepID=A0ABY5DH25_9ACTN|nr:DUF6879 family protein [Nocardiopsis exhalans]USY22478.1 hypothetical protein NE857_13205 [Nocardiopsis exhalans]